MKTEIETERKFIILMPDISKLADFKDYRADAIEQIYLPAEEGRTHRIRSRRTSDGVIYTETEKIRISKSSAIEKEGEITEERFLSLRKEMLYGTAVINKTRHSFEYRGQVFEIDIYPEWKRTAIMEAELPDENASFEVPSEIKIVREVTGDRNYSNAGMARVFPPEDEVYL